MAYWLRNGADEIGRDAPTHPGGAEYTEEINPMRNSTTRSLPTSSTRLDGWECLRSALGAKSDGKATCG
eukprot:4296160-Lingulodinium_polyedra.AAC.1